MPRLLPLVVPVLIAAVTGLLAPAAAAVPGDGARPTSVAAAPTVTPAVTATPTATPTAMPSTPAEDPSAAPTTDLSIEPFATATGDPGGSRGSGRQRSVAVDEQQRGSVTRERVAQGRPAVLPRTGGTVGRIAAAALLLTAAGALVVLTANRGQIGARSRHGRRA